MDIKQLEIFVTACERGSLSQAAACMYTTQPNVSKTIRTLEHELGRNLLIRSGKGVQPTVYGKTVLEYARLILKTTATIASLAIPDEQESLRYPPIPAIWWPGFWWISTKPGGRTFILNTTKERWKKLRSRYSRGFPKWGLSMWPKSRQRPSSIFCPTRSWNLSR